MDDSIGNILSFLPEDDKKYVYDTIKEIKIPFLKQVPINNLLGDKLFIYGLSLEDFEQLLKNKLWDRQKIFKDVVGIWKFDVIKLFLDKNIPDEDSLKFAMKYSCKENRQELLKILLTKLNPGFENNICVKIACQQMYPDILKILLEDGRANPTSECIRIAYNKPYYVEIKFDHYYYSKKTQLYEKNVSDFSSDDELYCQYGHDECMGCRYCRPFSKEDEDQEIIHNNNNMKILNLLLEDGRAAKNDWFKNIDINYQDKKILRVVKDGRTNVLSHENFIKVILWEAKIDYIVHICYNIKRCSLPYDNTEKNIKTLKLACMSELKKRQYKDGQFIFKRKNGYSFIPVNNTLESIKYNHVFISACKYGKEDIVEILLKDKRVNPAFQDNMAFRIASKYRKHKIVKILLDDKRIDPTSRNNEAFISIWKKDCFDENTIKTMFHLLNDPKISAMKDIFKITMMYAKKYKTERLLNYFQSRYDILQSDNIIRKI